MREDQAHPRKDGVCGPHPNYLSDNARDGRQDLGNYLSSEVLGVMTEEYCAALLNTSIS